MTRVGILRLNETPQFRDKIACVVAASMEIEAFFFRPQDVDFKNRVIHALHFQEDEWHRTVCEFPDVIYNHLPLTDEQKAIFNQLAQEIPFTTHRIGNKNVVLKQLAQDQKFQENLIPMYRIQRSKEIVTLVEKYKKVVLKPANGKQGKRIFTIEKRGTNIYDFYHLLEKTTLSANELVERTKEETSLNPMILQPFISSRTIHGHSFCMRVHLAKGKGGKWNLVKYFPFVSNNNQESVSHLSHGAFSTTRMDIFMKQNYPDNYQEISRKIVRFAREFPNHFETNYPYPLDALGIDLGISEDGNLYIYEVNSLPGTRYVEFQAEYFAMQYCEYLAQHPYDCKVNGLEKGITKQEVPALT